ncbi:MAG: phage tail sheath family protein [Gammaproteobacteria bacterium]|nr:phage tail sheath family protein [Gammaproteobacteria bacterium]MCF6260304.1 phage tail sheath family protein [Gammaproteobacteria bacterium]
MGQMKTPGVYIVEKNAFPNSVVEVATAVPAFIGYTERADNKGKSLSNKPWRITSMSEFHNYYGFGPAPQFKIEEKPADSFEETAFQLAGQEYLLNQSAGKYLLYYSMLLFFQNGGGPCYIVSVGNYEKDDSVETNSVEADKLSKGINLLVKEQEPTMVVVPETVLLSAVDSSSVQQAALAHCGGKMRNRVAILDVWGGGKDRQDPAGDCIDNFRSALGINYLDFATAYYPWVNTTIVQDSELSYENVTNPTVLQGLLRTELNLGEAPDDNSTPKAIQQIEMINNITSDWDGRVGEEVLADKMLLNKSLRASSPMFGNLIKEMREQLNLLPPAAAMAGVYTMVDNTRGVWKAPANVSLSAVVSPTVNITHDEQEDLNVTTQGKSINAIRSFIGEGTLVWGARTLDGNSLDWRYVNVRRTMIMLEESIRLATKAYVFEPNTANTWVTIKSMIRNFLTGIWKRGGLAGASPDDAFSVNVGLGETMTSEDILEGILRVTVLVAISRPAEFIEITFQQQMQKS